MKRKPAAIVIKELKQAKRALKRSGRNRLCAEASALIASAPYLPVSERGSRPLICMLVEETPVSDTESLLRLISDNSEELTNADFISLSWQVRSTLLLRAAASPENEGEFFSSADIDYDYIGEMLNPLHISFSEDESYQRSDRRTKRICREKVSRAASETGIPEKRLAHEYIMTAKRDNTDLCSVVWADGNRIFPHISVEAYIIWQMVTASAITLLCVLFSDWWVGLSAFGPAWGISKAVIDRSILRKARGEPLAAVKAEEALDTDTACVLSVLADSPEAIVKAAEKLKTAKIKNTSENIFTCMLCDLPPAKNRETDADDFIIDEVKRLSEASDSPVIIIRRREYSETQECYQGKERKRGAIEDLVRFCMGEEMDFRFTSGDTARLKNIKFLCALDYDTVPLMDSVNSLVCAALHPVNKNFGIIAPRITVSLSSAVKTGLTRLYSGAGGCSGISAYDSFDTELYWSCFGEGTFTGKGLIRTEKFYSACTGTLPEERVLSHDIIEGGLAGTAYSGDTEFSDSLPPTVKGYYKRQHRWIRGDFQNFFFIADRRLSRLTRFKLSDNIRRALMPFYVMFTLFLAAYTGYFFPAAVALLSVMLPFILGLVPAVLKGLGFSNTREFYSPVSSLSRNLVSRMFGELIFLPKNAVLGVDAFIRTVLRVISGKKLLEWQTASQFDKTGAVGYTDLFIPEAAALILLYVSLVFGNILTAIASGIMVFMFPAAVCLDRIHRKKTPKISQKQRERLISEAAKLWSFYKDYVTAEEHFLPPDNVQYAPVYRVARRTSPTNIGMYLLSCVCAQELSLTDVYTAETCISRTLETVEKLEKYEGNLYNWYSTEDLSVLGGFVSSVDSGNFLCCLTAVKEWLKEKNCSAQLIKRAERLLAEADLTVFFNKVRNLFSVGLDAKTGKIMPNCYDMLMSEARMLSYYAIATGQAEKSHWRALSRIMSKNGNYAGPVAWTGTMFEYFMPELLLESKEGSLSYEALNYAVYCQRERGKSRSLPFGISESGYFAFDRDLNYQYKAHGVQKLALCSGMDREYVVSPYSTFLALSYSFNACMANLSELTQPAFTHERYGCYEAIDLTERRTGGMDAVVKSHMAHHVGMSLGGITNALCNGRLKALFLSDGTMQRAEELLEERIMSGEVIIDIEKLREKRQLSEDAEEFTDFSVLRPRMNVIANRKISLFTADTGLYCGNFGGILTMMKSPDYLRRPRGAFFGIAADGREIPFFLTQYDRSGSMERSTVFGENYTEYYVNGAGLRCGMRISLYGENAAEIREFTVENLTNAERYISLTALLEPALGPERDISAHPAFSDLFMNVVFDEKEQLVFARRRNRSGGEKWLCAGFRDKKEFNYSFDREGVLTPNEPLSFMNEAVKTNNSNCVPSPCIFLDMPIKLTAGGKTEASFFICYGDSRNEVSGIAENIRTKEEEAAVSPLPKNTLQGRIARLVLPSLLYRNVLSEEILSARSSLNKRALWRFGISGDRPLLIYKSDGIEMNLEASVLTIGGLTDCGTEAELAIICPDNFRKERAMALVPDFRSNIAVISETELSGEEKELLKRSAVYIFGKSEFRKPPKKLMDIIPAEPQKTGLPKGFYNDCYIPEGKGFPMCHVLASREFGCILSQNALGFSYAMNSRENKLTPWYNDRLHDNDGEMLLLKGNGCYYDLISGSEAVFSPNKADYYSVVGKRSFHTSVRVFEKGMGKEITLTITNDSPSEKVCSVSYYTEPVLGPDVYSSDSGASFSYRSDENAIYIKNTANPEFDGEMAVFCDRAAMKTTDRERFLAGELSGEVRPFARSCAAVSVKIKLPPRGTEKVKFILSYSRGDSRKQIEAFKHVGTEWKRERAPQIESKNPVLDKLYATWLPWQAVGARMWARSGFWQNGGAYGFRDQLQDSLAALSFMPRETERQIYRCCASQFPEGDVLHWWHRTNSGRKGVRTLCSDDMLWLPFTASEYIKKTGDTDILSRKVQYIIGEPLGDSVEKYMEVENSNVREDVYSHCKKALEKCSKKGSHSLLKMGSGDWNDSYNRVGVHGRGESVWLSMFYVLTAKEFAPIARGYGDGTFADELEKQAAELTQSIESEAFDNGYYIRAFFDDGRKMGSFGNRFCQIDLLPQAFSVLADLPDKEKSSSALKNAYEYLVDEQHRLIKLFTPAFDAEQEDDNESAGYVGSYPIGVRENGGQYTHAAVWLALAFLRSGDKATAKRLADFLNPAERGKEFGNEPYYMTADIYTNPSAYGRGGWSIYTGAAGWYYQLLGELYGAK